MKFKVGDRVRYVGPAAATPSGFDRTVESGVVVGYWSTREVAPWFTRDEYEATDDVAYPYFVRGFVPKDDGFQDNEQCVYSEDELEAI